MILATVLVPTHEHDGTLDLAVTSALAQTVKEIEVLIVGDGPTDQVRAVGERLAALDPRVKFLPFPKGERHGEANRHAALEKATGRIVCYLADDDLWLPDHVLTMLPLLLVDRLAHTYPTCVSVDGKVTAFRGSAKDMLEGRNHVPLSAMGHTMAAYRALPVGWSPAPKDTLTDLTMWQKFLRAGFELHGSAFPTVACFPSPTRAGRSSAMRRHELEVWWRFISSDPWMARRALLGEVLAPS